MERDDIIRMAREAGLAQWSEFAQADAFLFAMPDRIERFAALVAAEVAKCEGCGKPHALYCLKCCEESIVQTAVKEEREACERIAMGEASSGSSYGWPECAYVIAKAIRARGEA